VNPTSSVVQSVLSTRVTTSFGVLVLGTQVGAAQGTAAADFNGMGGRVGMPGLVLWIGVVVGWVLVVGV